MTTLLDLRACSPAAACYLCYVHHVTSWLSRNALWGQVWCAALHLPEAATGATPHAAKLGSLLHDQVGTGEGRRLNVITGLTIS